MADTDQFQLIQEIADCVLPYAKLGWRELVITYHLDSDQSDLMVSHLVEVGGQVKEVEVPFSHELDQVMRRLQACMSQGGKEPFSSCRLHFDNNGKFNAEYGYGPIDWDALFLNATNFPQH